MKRILIGLLLVVFITVFFTFHLNRYLTLDALKSGQASFEALRSASPWLFAAGFLGVYMIVTALSLPGAAIMTLAGGALFGFLIGTVLVSIASTAGATLAFLSSRFLFAGAVERRFGERLRVINEGIQRDGAFYLFTLRLIPIVPFFVVNLLMGLTRIRVRTFYWVSQIGMLPATAAFVNAGTQLARIDHISQVASPQLLLSFAALGALPWISRAGVNAIRRRRVYAGFKRPKSFDRNLIVIGAGAAGLVSAYIAAAVRAKVTLVEAQNMGGDCLNFGCVPSKTLIRSAKLAQQMREAAHYGLEATIPRFSFRAVMARVHEVIREIAPHDGIERYTKLGVEVLIGHARLVDPWTLDISLKDGGTRRLTTRSVVIAAGAEPIIPRVVGIEDVGYVTSDTLWSEYAALDDAPRRLVVLGGGPIGCELAQCFSRLGSSVTLIHRGDRLIKREDAEVSESARATLEREGVTVLTDHDIVRCEKTLAGKQMLVQCGGEQKIIEFDSLLCAVGRKARLRGYGLEELGIPTDGTIATNEFLETRFPNIYAAGDVAGPYQFTHVAGHQAWYAVVNALFGTFKRFKVDYRVIPWTTFMDPEIARVGLNEQDARQRQIPFEVTRFELVELDRAIADGATRGFIKVLTVPGKDRILGATFVGDHAGDLLAEYVLAMKHGLGLNKILGTIHTYPTMAEANKYVAGEWKRAHAPQKVLAWLARYHDWRRGV